MAKTTLERQGYKVHRTIRSRFNSNDVFGCIDLVAKRRGERTRWIQVTSDGGIGRKATDLAEVPWDPLFDLVEVWQWKGRKMTAGMTREVWRKWQHFVVRSLWDDFDLAKAEVVPWEK
jgi:hypothetical protein